MRIEAVKLNLEFDDLDNLQLKRRCTVFRFHYLDIEPEHFAFGFSFCLCLCLSKLEHLIEKICGYCYNGMKLLESMW